MTLNRSVLAAIAVTAALLGGCSKQDSAETAKPAPQAVSVQTVAAQAKGFTVGAMMSANTVYVFFDPQCPHCGHLWQASLALHKKVKFQWIPVAWINASSLTQGAALLASADPLALMTEHEVSLLGGKGGIAASASIPAEVEQSIKANTKLLGSFGAQSVPYVVVKNMRTGETRGREGALTTQALAELIGVDAATP